MRLTVTPNDTPLRGTVPGPLDPDAATYALAVAALAEGRTSTLEGRGLPELPIVSALTALGVPVETITDASGRRSGLRVGGRGLLGMTPPAGALDAGDSVATMAALAALGAGLPFATHLVGDTTTMRRVMASVARVLRLRGGTIEGDLVLGGRVGEVGPPFGVGPIDVPLSPLTLELDAVAESAEARGAAKAAALVSGVEAEGTTQIYARTATADTVERLLMAGGADVQSLGPMIELAGPARLEGLRGVLPVDATFAVALLGAGLQREDSQVGVRRVPTRPTACGWLEALKDAGAYLHIEPKHDALGQPAADIVLGATLARGLAFGGERAARAGVALPVLAALAARAPEGAVSTLFDLDESASDALLELLAAFGVPATRDAEGLQVRGVGAERLRPVHVHCGEDAHLGLAALMLALGASGPSTLDGLDRLQARFPRVVATFRGLGADLATDDSERSGDASRAVSL